MTLGLAMVAGFGALSRFFRNQLQPSDGRVSRAVTYWQLGGSVFFTFAGAATLIEGLVRLI